MKKLFILAIAAVGLLACKGQNEPVAKNGALSGKFSVSPTTQVQFSQGNLQYRASTQTWRFAENQYDVLGYNNINISSTYDGWIDLFGWGTGNNPTNTSTDPNDYSIFTDWGVNAISNGGNEAYIWRTLTKDEWVYLYYTRTNAAFLFGLGSVNGINGVIILPDNWETPKGTIFTPSTTRGLVDEIYRGRHSYYNENIDAFSHNTYTVEQWSIMESAGAVFLPAAGYRMGTDVHNVGSGGYFWSADGGGNYAYYHCFNSTSLIPDKEYWRFISVSVRLVR